MRFTASQLVVYALIAPRIRWAELAARVFNAHAPIIFARLSKIAVSGAYPGRAGGAVTMHVFYYVMNNDIT